MCYLSVSFSLILYCHFQPNSRNVSIWAHIEPASSTAAPAGGNTSAAPESPLDKALKKVSSDKLKEIKANSDELEKLSKAKPLDSSVTSNKSSSDITKAGQPNTSKAPNASGVAA